MLDDLAVKFVHGVTAGVAVIDDSIVLVELTNLVTCAETRQVFRRHQVRAQGMAVEAYLACGGWRDTDDVG